MATTVKKTKTSLRQQRDSLERFQRYLPTLELKKQQLRMEVSRHESLVEEVREERRKFLDDISEWVRLFGEEQPLETWLSVDALVVKGENVAGVNIPVFEKLSFKREEVDVFSTPPWVDQGLEAIEELIRFDTRVEVLEEARDKLAEELRITSQRVNLFEKVMIPDTKENIRVIKIALGDAQTAGVVRSKIAKNKSSGLETQAG